MAQPSRFQTFNCKITGKKTPSKLVVSTVERDYEKSVYEKEQEFLNPSNGFKKFSKRGTHTFYRMANLLMLQYLKRSYFMVGVKIS